MTNFPPKLFTRLPVFGQTNQLRKALLTKVNNTKRRRNDTYLYPLDHVRKSLIIWSCSISNREGTSRGPCWLRDARFDSFFPATKPYGLQFLRVRLFSRSSQHLQRMRVEDSLEACLSRMANQGEGFARRREIVWGALGEPDCWSFQVCELPLQAILNSWCCCSRFGRSETPPELFKRPLLHILSKIKATISEMRWKFYRMPNFPPKLFKRRLLFVQTNGLRKTLLTRVNHSKQGWQTMHDLLFFRSNANMWFMISYILVHVTVPTPTTRGREEPCPGFL